MVLRLSDLLRYVTYDAQAEQVPLHKELAHIRAYIDLFQLKSETPLPIHFAVDGDTDQLQIEPLLLLPLVENALKHSDLDSNPKGFLNILLRSEPGQIPRFKVENTFDPNNQQKDAVGGVGLENFTMRLQLKYGNRYSFIVGAHDGVYTAELVLEM